VFQEHVPGARNQNHTTISGAGHFIAEQRGPELAAVVAGFVGRAV
jgi:haloalkane dehalogenase